MNWLRKGDGNRAAELGIDAAIADVSLADARANALHAQARRYLAGEESCARERTTIGGRKRPKPETFGRARRTEIGAQVAPRFHTGHSILGDGRWAMGGGA